MTTYAKKKHVLFHAVIIGTVKTSSTVVSRPEKEGPATADPIQQTLPDRIAAINLKAKLRQFSVFRADRRVSRRETIPLDGKPLLWTGNYSSRRENPFIPFRTPPLPPACLSSKGAGHQNVRSHTRILGPSVYSAYLARGRIIRMLGPIPKLSSKGTGRQNVRSHTRMIGPSVYPAYLARADHQNVRSHTRTLCPSVYPAYLARGQVIRMLGPIPECLVLQYFEIQILKDWEGGGSSEC